MTPSQWTQSQLRRNAVGAGLEFCLHLSILIIIILAGQHLGFLTQHRTIGLLCIIVPLHILYRWSIHWNVKNMWRHISSRPHGEKGLLLRDITYSRGHFPNGNQNSESLLKTTSHWEKPSLSIWHRLIKGARALLCTSLCCIAVLGTDQIPKRFFNPEEQAQIELTPPSYLQLPQRILHPMESEIKAYPGTLLRWTSKDPKAKLIDSQGRAYLSRTSPTGLILEARIMKERLFTFKEFGKKTELKALLLEDFKPTVQWLNTTNTAQFKPVSLSFQSEDDHSLEESLITIDGREIEYAGKSEEKKKHRYRWTFDPNDHLPLLGGNIVVEITSYDNDKINGPKAGKSPALVWKFSGIQNLAKDASKTIRKIKDLSTARQNGQKSATSTEIYDQLGKLTEQLRQNPALSPEVTSMAQNMQRLYQQHAKNNTPLAQANEKSELSRNDDILDSIQQMLDQITSFVRAAELVKEMSDMTEQLHKGKHDPKAMAKLYKKLEEHLTQSSLPDGMKQHMLREFNQAELNATMGDTQAAAKSMESLSEMMRQQPSGPNSPNPLAKKFQDVMKNLGQFINSQQEISKSWKDIAPQKHPKEKSMIQDLQKDIINHPHWKAHQKALQKTQQGNATDRNKTNDKQDLQRQSSQIHHGEQLHRTLQDLSRRMRGAQPAPSSKTPTPQDLAHWAPNIAQKMSQLLKFQKQNPTKVQPGQRSLQMQQLKLSKRAQDFSQKFKLDFEPIMPRPELFHIAEQGARLSKGAAHAIDAQPGSAEMLMGQASLHWVQLRQLLQQMQQQSQQQNGGGSSRPRLSIGRDGKLQLSPQGQPQGEGADGDWKHKKDDLDIALPEEFQNSRNIEETLRRELKKHQNSEAMENFKDYIIELLK